MGNYDYSFVFCDANGKPLGTPVDSLLAKKLNRARGQASTATVALSLTSALAPQVMPGSTRLKVYRAPSADELRVNVHKTRQLVFYGDAPPENFTYDTDARTLEVVFSDPRWRLARRWVDNGFFTGVPVTDDQGNLLWSLVSDVNVYDPTFLRQGNTTTGVIRQRTWEPRSVLSLIEDMAGVANGPDIDVEPWDGWSAAEASRDMGFFHVYARQGADKPTAAFLFGKGLPANIGGAELRYLPVTNRARVAGTGADDGSVIAADKGLPNYSYIGMLEDLWVEDSVSDQATLDGHAQQRVDTESTLREVLTLKGPTSKAPRPFEHYDVGDTGRATVRYGALDVSDRKVRIDAFEVDLSGALPAVSIDVESAGLAAPTQIGVASEAAPPIVVPPSPGNPPSITTLPAINVTTSGARLLADVIPGDADASVVFAYGPTAAHGSVIDKGTLPASTATSRVTHDLAGIAEGQTIHYEAQAVSANSPSGAPSAGGDKQFTTAVTIPLPVVATRPVDNIATDQARLRGRVNPGVAADTDWWLELSLTPFTDNAPGPIGTRATATQTIVGGGTTDVLTAVVMGGLTPGTRYYVRQVARGPAGVAYAAAVTFDTITATLPPADDPNSGSWNPGLFATWDGRFLGLGLYGVGTRPRTLVVYQGDVIVGPGYAQAIRPFTRDQASPAIPPGCISTISVPWSGSNVPCLQDIDIRGKVIGTNNPQNTANGGNPTDLNNDTFFDIAFRNIIIRNGAYSDTDPFKLFSAVNAMDDSGYIALRGCRYDIDQFELAYGPAGLSDTTTTKRNTDGTFDTSRNFPWWLIKPTAATAGGDWDMAIAWRDHTNVAHTTTLTALAHDIHPDDLQDKIGAAMKADAPGNSGAGDVLMDSGTRVTGALRRDGTTGVVRSGSWVGVTGFPANMYKQSYAARYALTFKPWNNSGGAGSSVTYGNMAIVPSGGNKTDRGVKITGITLTSRMTNASGGAVAFQAVSSPRSKLGYDDAMVLSKSAGIMQRFYNHHFWGDAIQRGPQFVQATAVARGTQVDKYGTHWLNPERTINTAQSNDHMDQCQFFTWDGTKNCLAHVDAVTGATVAAQANYWSTFAVYYKNGGQSCVFADGTDRQDTSAGVATPKPKRFVAYRCLFSGPNKGFYMENAVECGPVDCRFATVEDPNVPGKGVFSAANTIVTGVGGNVDLIAWQNKLDTGVAITRSGATWLNGTGGPP